MPYDRTQVTTSILTFYTFLTTHLHFHHSDLKMPTPNRLAADRPLTSRTKFTDLLKNLRYFTRGDDDDDDDDKHIQAHTVCADYNALVR